MFGYYAILISMLSYTAWHLGKPSLELFSTLIWGRAAAPSRSRVAQSGTWCSCTGC